MNARPETPVVDDWEVNGPPWLRSGGFRRDGKPSRGAWLVALSRAARKCAIFAGWTLLGGASLWLIPALMKFDRNGGYVFLGPALLGFFALPTTVALALLGLPLSGVAWFVAGRDLAEMARGERDPFNQPQTLAIQNGARKAFFFSLAWLLLGVANFAGIVWAISRME
jgi:hypothetical protein